MIDTHGEVQLNAIEKLIVTSNLQNFYAGLHTLKTVNTPLYDITVENKTAKFKFIPSLMPLSLL